MSPSRTDAAGVTQSPRPHRRARDLALQIGPVAICILVIPALFLLCNPFVEMGAGDDWTYAWMARVWAETGRLQYDGSTSAIALPHLAWGMVVIRLFGFSFTALRASMIPFGIGCSVLTYSIARWVGTSRWTALLASLGLVLSPLFVPVVTSYLTDIPALFLFLLTTWCVLRAADSARQGALLWLCAALLAGITAGALRQVMWGAPVIMLPVFGFIRRKDRILSAASLVMLLITGAAVVVCLRWFYSQPSILGQEQLRIAYTIQTLHVLLHDLALALLTIALFCLPAIGYLLGSRRVWRGAASAFGLSVCICAAVAVRFPDIALAPWTGNIVTRYGVLNPNEVVIGERPVILSDAMGYFIGTIVMLALIFMVARAVPLYRALNPEGCSPESPSGPGRLAIFLWITLPFFVLCLTLLAVRSVDGFFVDRYLLPLDAVALIGLLAGAERLPGRHFPFFAWACLALFGCYAVATTHDAFRLWEARARVADQLTQRGIARECISGGYEYDAWTELRDAGIIGGKLPPRNTPVDYWFLHFVPHVKPQYYVVVSRQSKLDSPLVADLEYSPWLPPRPGHVFVQSDPHASCPDSPGVIGK